MPGNLPKGGDIFEDTSGLSRNKRLELTPNNSGKVSRAFQERDTPPARKQLDLKLNNKNSMTTQLPKPIDQSAGQKQAEEVNARLNDYAAQGGQLALSFKKVVLDKTLPINKSILAKDAERGLITSLIDLGTAINNDNREQEGQGAMGTIALVLGMLLIQRDKINELGYVVETLEKQVHSLGNQVQALTPKSVEPKREPQVVHTPMPQNITLTIEQYTDLLAKQGQSVDMPEDIPSSPIDTNDKNG
jgi:hypothetical protein